MIELVQNRFLRTFARCNIEFPGYPEILRKPEISTLERRRRVATLIFAYSDSSGHVVCSLHEFFSLFSSTLPSRSCSMHRILPVTRRSKRLLLENCVFSSLPEVTVQPKNASAFKRKVRQ
ncbi:hypothetical protein L596_001776 [Steinernema carpocapsae]|uniref:Uncharacterized protein n=1 Tax=Steinernema carpocapsae TaxID=34508 RepID=A0A4U8UMR4_STECR|nr:hypothetical protein L596_001776 [Steinernema carpocapsae]